MVDAVDAVDAADAVDDDAFDELFRAPVEEFVARRGGLVRQLKAAGGKNRAAAAARLPTRRRTYWRALDGVWNSQGIDARLLGDPVPIALRTHARVASVRRPRRRGVAAGTGAVVVALLASSCAALIGPVTGPGPASNAWSSASLAANGVVEQEFQVAGRATAYEQAGPWGDDGRWPVRSTTTADFRTRIVVRRPSNPARFNGTVVVEWMNVSAGADAEATFLQANEELLRGGYAWVGVSAQKVGVDTLKRTNVGRYGSLVHPGDAYSYDIFTQAAQLVMPGGARKALDGLAPTNMIAVGESQSAMRLVTYLNAVNPLRHLFDGYLVFSRLAAVAPLNDTAVMPAHAVIRTDTPEPVIDIQTEGDLVVFRTHTVRQADSPTFRLWEVAGGAHADEHTLSPLNAPPSASSAGSPCTSRLNSNRTHMVVGAAISALRRWVTEGVSPAFAPRITLGDPNASDPIDRNRFGLAFGGIRLPGVDAPIATVDGLRNSAPPGAPAVFQTFCVLFGRTVPFAADQLAELYPDHRTYVDAVEAYTDLAVKRGFVLAPDGEQLKREAQASTIGT